ncbi:hypothetical protein GCM10010331_48890 [Streptomyces xanthochromogenes]|uniref:hypothetical protein n=1 Tax=Streptomyces xanthochromogenes TaxID=67384 RepID=UPI00167677AD|nr:hypothetical protein [Streptomyces xanthochromogenes]GHB55289.1 hypothetical protein GCM10010331_48890 [Streptomyces xanthochromogenes]
MIGDASKSQDVSAEAAVHIAALMDLFREACRRQDWTLNKERGLKGWTDVRCSAGHDFSVTALDVVTSPRPFGVDPGEPWCGECRNISWVAQCQADLKVVAEAQGIELTVTNKRDATGDGHVVFSAKCPEGHVFTLTGARTRTWRGDPVVLCARCKEVAEFAEGFAKIEAVVRETRSAIVKKYVNGADVRCRRGHLHTFSVDSWDGRQAIRPDFCGDCGKMAKFQSFSESAKDLGITILESKWIAASRPHRAVCFAAHEFGLVPNKMKRGCPECPRGMYGGSVPPHDVYYVVSGLDATTGKETVKPGISSGSGYNRLRQHAEDGLTAQHLRISGLPAGTARTLERFVLDGLDREGWLSTRGVEYFPSAALQDVLDLAGEWFTNVSGLSPRPVVVDVSDVYSAVEPPEVLDVVDVDVETAVIFDSDDARVELTR